MEGDNTTNGQTSSEDQNNVVDDISAADDSKKLFVGGLGWETTREQLAEYFGQWGTVTAAAIKLDRFTHQSRGFGFVVYDSEDSVEKALNVSEHRLNNKKIDPKKAKPPKEERRKVFVGGLDPEITEEQIREYFGQFGKIASLDLPFDTQKGKRKAFIFITYSTEAEAKTAANGEKQEINGKKCDVRIAVPPDQAKSQRQGWSGHNHMGYNNYGGYGGGWAHDASYGGAAGYYGQYPNAYGAATGYEQYPGMNTYANYYSNPAAAAPDTYYYNYGNAGGYNGYGGNQYGGYGGQGGQYGGDLGAGSYGRGGSKMMRGGRGAGNMGGMPPQSQPVPGQQQGFHSYAR